MSWNSGFRRRENPMGEKPDKPDQEEWQKLETICHSAHVQMILKFEEPMTREDERLVERAKAALEGYYQHGFHQLYALSVDSQGNEFDGLQLDTPIGQSSSCAEVGLMHCAAKRNGKPVTLVTVHRKKQTGDIHVANLCQTCCERLNHFFPGLKVILWLEGALHKVPVRILVPILFKRRWPNANGAATETFQG
ncbi:MAG: hypothetical protein ABH833_02375 [Parcubacteria group bacterium]